MSITIILDRKWQTANGNMPLAGEQWRRQEDVGGCWAACLRKNQDDQEDGGPIQILLRHGGRFQPKIFVERSEMGDVQDVTRNPSKRDIPIITAVLSIVPIQS